MGLKSELNSALNALKLHVDVNSVAFQCFIVVQYDLIHEVLSWLNSNQLISKSVASISIDKGNRRPLVDSPFAQSFVQ